MNLTPEQREELKEILRKELVENNTSPTALIEYMKTINFPEDVARREVYSVVEEYKDEILANRKVKQSQTDYKELAYVVRRHPLSIQ